MQFLPIVWPKLLVGNCAKFSISGLMQVFMYCKLVFKREFDFVKGTELNQCGWPTFLDAVSKL